MRRNINRRTRALLREFGIEVTNAVKSALANCAEEIVQDAKSRCPVKTGKLRESIKAQKQQDGATYKISTLYYGRFVELSPHINRPFLYPALDANKENIRNAIKAAIRQT